MDSYDSNQILILLDFWTIFRDLQDLQSFAPLESSYGKNRSDRKIRKMYSKLFIQNLHFQIERAIFRQNFDEILSEFHEHAPKVKNFQFLEKKDPIFRKIRENFGNVQIIQKIIQKIIQNYSVVSLVIARLSRMFTHSVSILRSSWLSGSEGTIFRE